MILTLNRPQNASNLLLCDVGTAVSNNASSCVCTSLLQTTVSAPPLLHEWVLCLSVCRCRLQTPYWIEPEIASSLTIVASSPDLKWIRLEGIGADGVVVPSLYHMQGGVGVRICSVATPSQASVTALLSATATAIIFQLAYPTPTDRTLYGASIENDVCSKPYAIPVPYYPLRSTLRGYEAAEKRVWESASVNREGSFAIMSTQSPTMPSAVLLGAVCCTVPPWSPALLLTNTALSTTVAKLPIPSISFISVPSAQTGVMLNGYIMKPVGFADTRKYPALIYVYGGPGSQTVMSTYAVSGKTNKFLLWMASQGYVVISVDGRGTGAR